MIRTWRITGRRIPIIINCNIAAGSGMNLKMNVKLIMIAWKQRILKSILSWSVRKRNPIHLNHQHHRLNLHLRRFRRRHLHCLLRRLRRRRLSVNRSERKRVVMKVLKGTIFIRGSIHGLHRLHGVLRRRLCRSMKNQSTRALAKVKRKGKGTPVRDS